MGQLRAITAVGLALTLLATGAAAQSSVFVGQLPTTAGASGAAVVNQLPNIGAGDYGTEDDAYVAKNPTAATASTTVQASPNVRLTGQSWISGANKSCDVILTYVPSTTNGIDSRPGGYYKWMSRCTGDTTPQEMARLSNNGNFLATSGIDAGFGYELALPGFVQGDLSASYNGAIYWRGSVAPTSNPTRVVMNSPARGVLRFYESNLVAAGVELNIGTARPTLSSCGTGAMGATATNIAGGFTTTGAGATCTLNFGSPAWTNTPSCIFMDASRSAALRTTALSTTSYTISGFTAGDSVFYICLGGY